MKDVTAQVVYNEPVGERYFRLGLKVGWSEFQPGQFVMVEIPKGEAFLRRPFGIVKIENGILEVCVKIVGKGTSALSQLEAGQGVQVLGPLGRGFTIPKEIKTAVLVAGGYGIAPLVSLARVLRNEGKEVLFYYGAKSSTDLLYLDELKAVGVKVRLATEDGSAGEKGIITDVIANEVKQSHGIATAPLGPRNDSLIFACGPEGLLKEVARIAVASKIPAQVSLERYMACGMGVCLGCVVKARDGNYVRVCKEGPVFDICNLI